MSGAVFIVGEGSVTGLAGGPLSLADLGPRKTRRASHVEFDESTQMWLVTDAVTKQLLHWNADYDKAIAWETSHYNRVLAEEGLS